jgi:hypothetical protein
MQKSLDLQIEKIIEIFLNLNFEGLYQLCSKYAVKDEEKSNSNSSSSIN